MYNYFRPRRGKYNSAKSQYVDTSPLKRGEVFFELPDTGVGTGHGKIKMGDGETGYKDLPYFLSQTEVDFDNAVIEFTNSEIADDEEYINDNNSLYLYNISPSATLKRIFTDIKQLIINYNYQLNIIKSKIDSINQCFIGELQYYSPSTILNNGTKTTQLYIQKKTKILI